METEIRALLGHALKKYESKLGIEIPDPLEFDLNVTRDPSHGDFATNIAFKLTKVARTKPAEVAESLVPCIQESIQEESKESFVQKIEVAGAGFINFYLSKASMTEVLLQVRKQDEKFGQSDFGKGRKVLLEFVSANPTGPLTIAHGRQAAVGDCLARILKTTGYEATKEFYLNDAGRQIQMLGESVWVRYQEEFEMETEFPEDGYHGEYIREIAKKIVSEKRDELLKEDKHKAITFCADYAKSAMMGSIEKDLGEFRVVFDNYFSEKTLYEKDAVNKALNFLKEKKFIYEEDGAVWFRSTDFGDDKDRVVKKSSGDFTYLAPDIAYHRHKFERGHETLVNLWGPDHHGYITRLKAACQSLGHPSDDIQIRIVQLTTLFRQGEPVRMSTRAGEFVTLEELMKEAGVDATRFFFIMRRVESPLDFDLDLAKEKSQDNPVYYLQYAHARICGILKFAERTINEGADLSLLDKEEEMALIKVISDYPNYLVQASEMLEPYRVTDYLKELATSFHKFYAQHRVVTEDEELTQARLYLADAVRIVLRNGLELLGISQPESM